MPQPDIDGAIVYGVSIRLPSNPNWQVLCKRLKAVPKGEEANKDNDQDDAVSGPEEPKTKIARIVHPVLIQNGDEEDNGEEEYYERKEEYEFEELTGEITAASIKAIDKILAQEGHGLVLRIYAAGGDAYDREPCLLLEQTKKVTGDTIDLGPGARAVGIRSFESVSGGSDDDDKNIRLVMDHLGLEADNDIGWQLVVVHSTYF